MRTFSWWTLQTPVWLGSSGRVAACRALRFMRYLQRYEHRLRTCAAARRIHNMTLPRQQPATSRTLDQHTTSVADTYVGRYHRVLAFPVNSFRTSTSSDCRFNKHADTPLWNLLLNWQHYCVARLGRITCCGRDGYTRHLLCSSHGITPLCLNSRSVSLAVWLRSCWDNAHAFAGPHSRS